MTALLHITIFLCGVAATLTCIGIYCCVANFIENYTDKKIKEILNNMYNPRTLTFDPSKCERWDIEGKKIK